MMTSRTGTPFRDPRSRTRATDIEQQMPQPVFVAHVLGQILQTAADNGRAAARAYTLSDRKNPYPRFAEVA